MKRRTSWQVRRCGYAQTFSDCRLPNGFTYIELVMTLLVLGILVMIGLPALSSSMRDSTLAGAAREVVNALEYAQLQATSGTQTRVVIEDLQNSIAVAQFRTSADFFNGGDTLAAALVEGGTFELMDNPTNKGSAYQIDLDNTSQFEGVDIAASDFDGADPVIFSEIGSPSKGGVVILSLGNAQAVITLNALSGKVTVSD